MDKAAPKGAAILLLSQAGEATAKKIREALPSAMIHALSGRTDGDIRVDDMKAHIHELFKAGHPIIGLCASGILIRLLAPLITDKWSEPPVLSVSEDGRVVVPLLGGHHGANALAEELAERLPATPAITTSSDRHFGIALDDPAEGYACANPTDAKAFVAALLAGETIQLEGEAPWLEDGSLPFSEAGMLKITVTERAVTGDPHHLVYHPKTVVLGMGSERGSESEEATDLAHSIIKEADIASESIAAVASIDLKADEAGLHAVAQHLNVPIRFFTPERLAEEEARLETPSDVVKAEIGIAGVAESAALASVGDAGRLLVAKRKSKRVTAALAIASEPLTSLPGRARGHVALVGVGPGQHLWRTYESIKTLRTARHWVGYDLYLDLVKDLRTHQTEHRFPLGAEEKRVRHALELAAKGEAVAVVCSGDPGIFAMATLAYELIDTGAAEGALSDGARRVELQVVPGISAFQAAAARSGAPIGHDFACISLSDLLTPRDQIIKRLHAVASGDLVVAIYNPRSKRRITLLDEAFDILRAHRPQNTPVILATDLGRQAERVRVETLETVNSADVDMLTLVMVGASQSRAVVTGDGKTWVYTPRGYDRKKA